MRLEQILRLLFEHPYVVGLLAVWLVGIVGKSVQKKQAAEAARRRREGPVEAVEATGRRPRTPEEVAAEMRRILGMDAPRHAQSAPAPTARPLVATPRREATEGDVGPTPLRPGRLGNVEIHVDPHVGESVQRRAAPVSGQVAGQALGTLGGRTTATRATAGVRRRMVLLDDLRRAIVMREVLDEPRGLRGWDR